VAPGSQGNGQGQEQAPPGRHRRPGILVSTSIVAIKDEHGEPFAFEIISRNITGRKAIEDRMINMEKLASIGTLAAGWPMRSIIP